MTNEEIFKKLEAFAENRRDDCSENGETHNTRYWVGYLDGLRILYEKITGKEVTTNVRMWTALNVQGNGLNGRLNND